LIFFPGQTSHVDGQGELTYYVAEGKSVPEAKDVYKFLNQKLLAQAGNAAPDGPWKEVLKLKVAVFAKQITTDGGFTEVTRANHQRHDPRVPAFAYNTVAYGTQFVGPGDAFKVDHKRECVTVVGGISLAHCFDI